MLGVVQIIEFIVYDSTLRCKIQLYGPIKTLPINFDVSLCRTAVLHRVQEEKMGHLRNYGVSVTNHSRNDSMTTHFFISCYVYNPFLGKMGQVGVIWYSHAACKQTPLSFHLSQVVGNMKQ